MHFIALAEEHDPGCAGIQEADDAARLQISPRAAPQAGPHGFDRRPRALGGGIVHWQRHAARHAANLALPQHMEANRELEARGNTGVGPISTR